MIVSAYDLASSKGLIVVLPKCVLRRALADTRKIIEDGVIGSVIGCMAHIGTHGVERHHPNPDFSFGGGPLLVGPYYLNSHGVFDGAYHAC